MDTLRFLSILILFNFIFLVITSQQEINSIFKNIFNFLLKTGEFTFKNINLNNIIGNFIKTINEPFKSLITILLIVAAVFIFLLFLKNLIITIVLLIIFSIVIYLIFSL